MNDLHEFGTEFGSDNAPEHSAAIVSHHDSIKWFEAKANCRRTAQPDHRPVAESDGGSSSSGPALQFPSAIDVMKEP